MIWEMVFARFSSTKMSLRATEGVASLSRSEERACFSRERETSSDSLLSRVSPKVSLFAPRVAERSGFHASVIRFSRFTKGLSLSLEAGALHLR